MKINAIDLKIGNIIQHNNGLWKVAKLSHTQPGKGGDYIQAELKNIATQSKSNERFRSAESVEKLRAEEIKHQFRFRSGEDFTFRNNQHYEKMAIKYDVSQEVIQKKLMLDGITANHVLEIEHELHYAPVPIKPYDFLQNEFRQLLRFTLGFTTPALNNALKHLFGIHCVCLGVVSTSLALSQGRGRGVARPGQNASKMNDATGVCDVAYGLVCALSTSADR